MPDTMSALGQKRTYAVQQAMSALPPKGQTYAVHSPMSALGHKRTSAIHSITSSARDEQPGRNFETEPPCCFEIDK